MLDGNPKLIIGLIEPFPGLSLFTVSILLSVWWPFVIYFWFLVISFYPLRILIIRTFFLPSLSSFFKLLFEYFLIIFFGLVPAIIMPFQEPLVLTVGRTAIFSFIIHPPVAGRIFIDFRICDLDRFFELLNPFRRYQPYIILPECIVSHEHWLLDNVA